jgi:hypothetical protein
MGRLFSLGAKELGMMECGMMTQQETRVVDEVDEEQKGVAKQ